jgi:hypothetical protein
MSELEPQTPPAGESIHLPGGTPLPFLMAFGIAMTVVGTTIGKIWTILGLITFLVTLFLWVRDARAEIDHLPEEHH